MKKIAVLIFTIFILFPKNLNAADKIDISYTAGYMSNYLVNGVEENGGKGTSYFNIFFALPKNFYAGAWTAEVDPLLYGGADHEIDYYFGYSNSYKNISYDFSHVSYYYLDSTNEGQSFGEFFAKFKYSINDLVTLGYDFGKLDQGDNTETINYYLSYNFNDTNIKANIGDSEGYSNFQGITLSKQYKSLNLELSYVDTEMKTPDPNKDKDFLILSISKSF